MRVKIQFGKDTNTTDIIWNKTIKEFPTLISYQGDKWSFFMYEPDPTYIRDHIFYFSLVAYGNSGYWHFAPHLFDIAPTWGDKTCQCGARHNRGFETFHMYYCSLWKKKS